MAEAAGSSDAEQVKSHQRMLGLLLAAAMFVLVVDTSLMNATVSGVQSAIALEALVSAAFILIGGKVGDLIGPAAEKQQVAQALEENAQLMTNTQLEQLLVNQPPEIQNEIIRINTEARPISLQVALLIPSLAGLVGLFNSFRMMRLPDPKSSGAEGMSLG